MRKKAAILGGVPVFEQPVKQQNYLPEWDQFTVMVDGIFSRKYYTNHGPLAQTLEKRMSEFLGVKHSVCMTNTGIGLMIAAKALDLNGKVLLPAFSHLSLAQSVIWAGLTPVFCDVDEATFHLDTESLEKKIDKDTVAILGVNLFGGTCDFQKVERLANAYGVKHYYLSSDAIGQTYNTTKVGNFGSLEIFSLHESNIVNGTDGCVITTNDDLIAARLRNIRSSYGAGKTVPIGFTGNGRMSEVQAGVALLTMDQFKSKVESNKSTACVYENGIKNIEGALAFVPGHEIEGRNFQKFIVQIDEGKFGMNATTLAKVLKAENIFTKEFSLYARTPFPPYNALADMPIAANCSSTMIELPLGSYVSESDASLILETLKQVKIDSGKIKDVLLPGT